MIPIITINIPIIVNHLEPCFSINLVNKFSNLYDKYNKKININLEDEIIEKTLIK